MSGDPDFDKMMQELDSSVEAQEPAAPAPAPAAPARRGRKTATVVTDTAAETETALAAAAKAPATQQVTPEPAPEPVFVKIAGMASEEPQSVTVTVVENAPAHAPYISPQTMAEMEAGRSVLNRFK